jgi:hypothetical protein
MALCAAEAAEAGVKDAGDGAGDAEAGSDEAGLMPAVIDSASPSSSSAEAEDPRLLLPLPDDRRGWSAFADHDDGGSQRAAALDCFVASAPRNDGSRNDGSCAPAASASDDAADDDPPPKPPD